jgi:hypothetical protein
VRQGHAGRTDFSGKNLQDFDQEGLLGLHERIEVVAGDEADLRAASGNGGKRVGLIANDAGQSEQRAGYCLRGHEGFAIFPGHGESDLTLEQNVQTRRWIALMEKNAVVVAGDWNGVFLQRLKEFRVGKKCRWIKLHVLASLGEMDQGVPGRNTEVIFSLKD